jgi:hypothetical protein
VCLEKFYGILYDTGKNATELNLDPALKGDSLFGNVLIVIKRRKGGAYPQRSMLIGVMRARDRIARVLLRSLSY